MQPRTGRSVRFGLFELDPAAAELRREGRRVHLQDKPLQLLLALLERPGEVVTREELQSAAWEGTDFLDFDASLNSSVRKLRHALGDSADAPRFVATVPRHGYRFIAPVSLADPVVGQSAEEGRGANRRWGWAALSLLAVSFAVAALWRVSTPHEVPARNPEAVRLAVLPLINLDPDGEREIYTDGLTEELIAGLGALDPERLVVIARTSAMTYKGTYKGIPEIGRELGVDYVLEGSARDGPQAWFAHAGPRARAHAEAGVRARGRPGDVDQAALARGRGRSVGGDRHRRSAAIDTNAQRRATSTSCARGNAAADRWCARALPPGARSRRESVVLARVAQREIEVRILIEKSR